MTKFKFSNEAVKDLEEIWSCYKQIEDEVILIVRILHQRMDTENRMK